MFWLKKLLFKCMELGLGLRTCFSLETRNPIFVNFRLSEEEAERIRRQLPKGFTLEKIRFCESDAEPAYWLSYNLYELKYPKKELAAIRKARCEINTFVTDARGRRGIYVFAGSPYVSREERPSLIGRVCDLAERAVIFIYGCGKLVRLAYEAGGEKLRIELREGPNAVSVDHRLSSGGATERLSDDYWAFNDISFFNRAKTYDLVNVNSAFYSARFERIEGALAPIESEFFRRPPDRVYLHRGDISYIVNSMNPGVA